MNQTAIDSLRRYSLSNSSGLKIDVTSYGARIISIFTPDKHGELNDIVLGYDAIEQYLTNHSYYGATIGRYANRIARGKFSLNGKEYQLAINNGPNALHGGHKGFHQVRWEVVKVANNSIRLTYHSIDGEDGYPGNMDVVVVYTLSEDNALIVDYEATTDQDTIINLTHHSFFNLAGEGNGDVLNHELMINAEEFTPIDSTLIPTGELRKVRGTPFDFTTPHHIGDRINDTEEQLRFGNGYDHNFVLKKVGKELSLAAKVSEPNSGRQMEVWTTEPGMQFYSGNFLDGHDTAKGGKRYFGRAAFCLETQHFPDSPNHPDFPSTMLKRGEIYRQKTIYKFGVVK